MHLFGLMGSFMFLIGLFSTAYIGISKLLKLFYLHTPTQLVTDNPWFYIALTTMMIGTLFFLSGFIGELIVRSKRDEALYNISDKLNL
jgi:hypothetical protein